MKIAMIGAGNIASALARYWVDAGHQVMLSNSRGPDSIRDAAHALGASVGTPQEAIAFGDILVVSIPLKAFDSLIDLDIGNKIVIDTCNYYPKRDGVYDQFEGGGMTTSQELQRVMPQARIVKAFNSIMVGDLEAGGGPVEGGAPHALPIASDDESDAQIVADLVRVIGLEPVYTGSLAQSWRFERARPVYCRPLSAQALRDGLAQTTPQDFVAENAWKRAAS